MSKHKLLNRFNCVHYHLEDDDYKPEKSKPIYKLIPLTFYSNNELTNQQKIQKYNQHFYVSTRKFELNINELPDEIDDNTESNVQHLYSDKSTILVQFPNRKIIYLKNYLKELNDPKQYVSIIIQGYKHLLTSIHLLVQHQLVHNNITFNNLVIDRNETLLLSNFSLSIDISHSNFQEYISRFVFSYEPSYIEWPLEFHLLAYIQTNKLKSLSKYNIENIINEVTKENYILSTYGQTFVSSYKEEAIKYFMKYVNKPLSFILTDCLQYYYSWDNYSLSILFLDILIHLHKSMKHQNKFIIMFMKLLVCNIHMSPEKRLTINETVLQFNSILDNIEPSIFKRLINDLTVSS